MRQTNGSLGSSLTAEEGREEGSEDRQEGGRADWPVAASVQGRAQEISPPTSFEPQC